MLPIKICYARILAKVHCGKNHYEREKSNLLLFGIFNAISVIPFAILTSVTGFLLMSIHQKLFPGSRVPEFEIACSLVIYFLSPVFCIRGIVKGVRCWESGYGRVCLIFSIIGLLFFAVVTVFLMSVTV